MLQDCHTYLVEKRQTQSLSVFGYVVVVELSLIDSNFIVETNQKCSGDQLWVYIIVDDVDVCIVDDDDPFVYYCDWVQLAGVLAAVSYSSGDQLQKVVLIVDLQSARCDAKM